MIPPAAVQLAEDVLLRAGVNEGTRATARGIIAAVTPYIRDAERDRLRELLDPGEMELLAAWLDLRDAGDAEADPAMQTALRRWASLIRSGQVLSDGPMLAQIGPVYGSVGCTCATSWGGSTPPPPCPVHSTVSISAPCTCPPAQPNYGAPGVPDSWSCPAHGIQISYSVGDV